MALRTADQAKLALDDEALLPDTTLQGRFMGNDAMGKPEMSCARAEQLEPIGTVDELNDARAVFEGLSEQDWSFKDDDTGYLTHDLHPFPAKFIPQIPANLILRLSMPGDVVLDPFGGSATTAVEAVRLRRQAISLDANPVCALIGRVKTGFMADSVRAELERLSVAVKGHILDGLKGQHNSVKSKAEIYSDYQPTIPNVEKWFKQDVVWELCLLRHLIDQTSQGLARDAAQLALSRIIVRVSNQESETRYVSVAKKSSPSLTLHAYLESLRTVVSRMNKAAQELQFSSATFLVGDSRYDLPETVGENSVDLIVCSPPYPNATDYHLYHRFRLFWLGYDPRSLGKIEIGSHLRHQRQGTGFEEYRSDMADVIDGCFRILRPGRYAVFVVGDAVFQGKLFSTFEGNR